MIYSICGFVEVLSLQKIIWSAKLYGLQIANPHLRNLRKFVDLRFVELILYADRPPLNVVDIKTQIRYIDGSIL